MSNVIMNIDLSQAELRCMAMFSGDQWMINALQEGEGDFFNNHMMPVCYPWIEEDWGTVEEFEAHEPTLHKELRTKVKGVQYGLAFGRGSAAIAKALGMTRNEAEQIISNYFDTAPSFAQWRRDIMTAAILPEKRDLLVSPTGRRFQSELITSKNFQAVQREALSFLPQSTSSDICLMSAIVLHNDDMFNSSGFKIFNVVHDAIMMEGPESSLEDYDAIGQYVGFVMRETGQSLMGDAVPFLSEYSIGRSWSELS